MDVHEPRRPHLQEEQRLLKQTRSQHELPGPDALRRWPLPNWEAEGGQGGVRVVLLGVISANPTSGWPVPNGGIRSRVSLATICPQEEG